MKHLLFLLAFLPTFIFASPPPTALKLGNDTILCAEQTLLLNAKRNDAISYLWQDGSSQATFQVRNAGFYKVSITTVTATFSDSIHVVYFTKKNFSLGKDTSLCEGNLLIKNLIDVNAQSYKWQDGFESPFYLVQKSGIYSVTATLGNCAVEDTFQVKYNPYPILSLGNDTTVCKLLPIILGTKKQNFTCLWSDGEKSPQRTFYEAGTFWLKISKNGCSVSDTITLHEQECKIFQYYAPNAFSPNADNNNDDWKIFVHQDYLIKQFLLQIFDQWGNQLFDTQDITQSWAGENAEIGNYVYRLSMVYFNPYTKKEVALNTGGDINLLR